MVARNDNDISSFVAFSSWSHHRLRNAINSKSPIETYSWRHAHAKHTQILHTHSFEAIKAIIVWLLRCHRHSARHDRAIFSRFLFAVWWMMRNAWSISCNICAFNWSSSVAMAVAASVSATASIWMCAVSMATKRQNDRFNCIFAA